MKNDTPAARALIRDMQSQLNACCGLSKFQHQWLRELVTQSNFKHFVLVNGEIEETFSRSTEKLTPLNVLWYDTNETLHLDRVGVNKLLSQHAADESEPTPESREQLTLVEADALRTMLDRTTLATMLGALGVLCEERRAKCAEDGLTVVASVWAAASVILAQTERNIRHRFGA